MTGLDTFLLVSLLNTTVSVAYMPTIAVAILKTIYADADKTMFCALVIVASTFAVIIAFWKGIVSDTWYTASNRQSPIVGKAVFSTQVLLKEVLCKAMLSHL